MVSALLVLVLAGLVLAGSAMLAGSAAVRAR
jgi:hypothetical protein